MLGSLPPYLTTRIGSPLLSFRRAIPILKPGLKTYILKILVIQMVILQEKSLRIQIAKTSHRRGSGGGERGRRGGQGTRSAVGWWLPHTGPRMMPQTTGGPFSTREISARVTRTNVTLGNRLDGKYTYLVPSCLPFPIKFSLFES